MDLFSSFSSVSSAFFVGIIFVVTAVLNIVFAIAVYIDGKSNGTKLVWPSIWGIVTLFGGPLVAAAYWVVCRLKLEASLSNQEVRNKTPEDKIAQHMASIKARRETKSKENA